MARTGVSFDLLGDLIGHPVLWTFNEELLLLCFLASSKFYPSPLASIHEQGHKWDLGPSFVERTRTRTQVGLEHSPLSIGFEQGCRWGKFIPFLFSSVLKQGHRWELSFLPCRSDWRKGINGTNSVSFPFRAYSNKGTGGS